MTPGSKLPTGLPNIGIYIRAAISCLSSPSSIAAIALLLLNDHVLKPMFPSWLTGKLSDFAGLYFAPYLLALALLSALWIAQHCRSLICRRPSLLLYPLADGVVTFAFTAVAVLFSAIKLAPTTSEPALGLIELLLGAPVVAVVDPSDLAALIVLPPAYLIWRRKSRGLESEPGSPSNFTPSFVTPKRVARIALLAVATLAVVATSPSMSRPTVTTIVADPNYPNLLYASERDVPIGQASSPTGAAFNPRLYRTIDGGRSWKPLGGRWGVWTRGADAAERILPDPHNPAAFYMLWQRSIDYFTDISSSYRTIWPPQDAATSGSDNSLAQGDRSIQMIVPTWQADLIYIGGEGQIARSRDGGRSWDYKPLPGSHDGPVDVLSYAEAQPGLLFAAQGTSLLRSDDWGSKWSNLAVLDAQLVDVAIDPKRANLVIAATKRSLLKSTDSGQSWHSVWTRPQGAEEPTGQVLFDTRQDGTIHAAMGRAGLLTSSDQGDHWGQTLSDETSAVTLTHSRYPRLFVAAVREGVYRQRSPIHWPWIGDWEVMNSDLGIYRSDFGDRLVNLLSWLTFLTVIVALVGAFAPVRGRSWLKKHVWEICLAFWALIPSLGFGWGIASGTNLERSIDNGLFVSLMSIGAIVATLKTRISWAIWSMMAASQGLLWGTLVVHERDSLFPVLVMIPASAIAAALLVGLVGSAVALRAGRLRAGKTLLVLSLTLVNLPVWLFLLFTSSFRGSVGG